MTSVTRMASSMRKARPYLAVIAVQFGLAGLAIIAKKALNKGLNHYVFTVYRHTVATIVISPFALYLERNKRPKMTVNIFAKILLLSLLEPVIDQNLYYMGMKRTTATFTIALANIVPALTFIMAWLIRLERVNIRRLHSQAKVAGTLVTVGGATLMTLVRGPVIKTPWNRGNSLHNSTSTMNLQHPIIGAVMISSGCVCWSCFIILQAVTLKSYPAELSLTALICLAGAVEGGLVALVMEREHPSIWALHFDSKLLACVYGGIVCSGMWYYLQGVVLKEKGPVFAAAFNPLSMVIVTILGSFILSEQFFIGRIIGAVVIVLGLYLVIWGKSKDQKSSELNNNEQILPVESPKARKNETAVAITHYTGCKTNTESVQSS